jgi:predicted ATP-grasp superfamily ATP-dependent carboligase
MRVLVLDGNQNQAVASVRSLAQAGHRVLVGESARWSKAGWSRFSRGTFQYPGPREDAAAFVRRIAEVAGEEPGTLVLPMTEATTLPISRCSDLLIAARARLVLPEHSNVVRAFDKHAMIVLAASLGIAVPKTTMIRSAAEARDLARSISHPVVLKPRSSEELSTGGRVRTTGRPRYASNADQVLLAYNDISSRASAVLVQDFVSGQGMGYFALLNRGELRAEFAHRRIRDVIPTGSGSAMRESVEPDPEIRRSALAILKALEWHGVAMVEFRRADSQPPVFMEVNGRFWHSLPLACYAGADFPAMLAGMAEEGDIPPLAGYRTGVRCRWLLGDARHLLEVWKGAPRGYPEAYPGRFATLLSVLKPVRGTYHDLFEWHDPLPELGDWLSFAQRAVKTLGDGRRNHA